MADWDWEAYERRRLPFYREAEKKKREANLVARELVERMTDQFGDAPSWERLALVDSLVRRMQEVREEYLGDAVCEHMQKWDSESIATLASTSPGAVGRFRNKVWKERWLAEHPAEQTS